MAAQRRGEEEATVCRQSEQLVQRRNRAGTLRSWRQGLCQSPRVSREQEALQLTKKGGCSRAAGTTGDG